jgi:hypothetical protein
MSRGQPSYFVTSRFTKDTEVQCRRHLNGKDNPDGCLYGSSSPMSSIPEGALVFVIEMRINDPGEKNPANWLPDDNLISGIGMIVNREIPADLVCEVYDNPLFNQFTYIGKQRIDRRELLRWNPLLIELLDTILFKGKSHQKRNTCLSVLKDDFLKEVIIKNKLRNIVKTQVEAAITRGEIDPSHLNDLLTLDVKQSILEIFQQKRAVLLSSGTALETGNGKRKAAPTTEVIIPTYHPNKFTRENDDEDEDDQEYEDNQELFDFIDGYEQPILQVEQVPPQPMIQSEKDDGDDCDLSDFLNFFDWSDDSNLKADAQEEAVYNSIYNGDPILAATV